MTASKKDIEVFTRMALSKMVIAEREIDRIRNEMYDCPEIAEAQTFLHNAISAFRDGRSSAAAYFGFIPQDSMPT